MQHYAARACQAAAQQPSAMLAATISPKVAPLQATKPCLKGGHWPGWQLGVWRTGTSPPTTVHQGGRLTAMFCRRLRTRRLKACHLCQDGACTIGRSGPTYQQVVVCDLLLQPQEAVSCLKAHGPFQCQHSQPRAVASNAVNICGTQAPKLLRSIMLHG